MSAPMITVFAHPDDRPCCEWSGNDGDIPVLFVAGVNIHLTHLGDGNLRPWLLALSARLAEFAESVGADGTRAALEGVEA